jgi:hypothetical protein
LFLRGLVEVALLMARDRLVERMVPPGGATVQHEVSIVVVKPILTRFVTAVLGVRLRAGAGWQ